MKIPALSSLLTILLFLTLMGCSRGDAFPARSGFHPQAITLKEVADFDLKELIDEELVFIDSAGVEWMAPRGTLTDGASVPRLALWVTDGRFDSRFLKAAVIHDAYCQTDNAERCPGQYQTRPWKAVHRMFYEACLAGGTSPAKARIMFAAVWLGGPRWNDPDHSLERVPDDALRTEFAACEKWIEKEDPTIAEIETWMEKRETALLAAGNPSANR